MALGKLAANMPTKCIDQTPVASVSADPASARRLRNPSAESSSRASDKPTKLPWMAMAIERATSHGSCGMVISAPPLRVSPAARKVTRASRVLQRLTVVFKREYRLIADGRGKYLGMGE